MTPVEIEAQAVLEKLEKIVESVVDRKLATAAALLTQVRCVMATVQKNAESQAARNDKTARLLTELHQVTAELFSALGRKPS
jgi:hypothetical protein